MGMGLWGGRGSRGKEGRDGSRVGRKRELVRESEVGKKREMGRWGREEKRTKTHTKVQGPSSSTNGGPQVPRLVGVLNQSIGVTV